MMHFLLWVVAQQIQAVRTIKQVQQHEKRNARKPNVVKVLL
jgi:hypothetical protein